MPGLLLGMHFLSSQRYMNISMEQKENELIPRTRMFEISMAK